MIDISLLIVNYNTADLVKRCIQSVLKQRDVNFEIIVIDNASKDHSVETLRQFGHQITLIANHENVGFGRANNQGFKVSNGRYLFLLNPDANLLTEHDLLHAIQFMDKHTDTGLAGTRIVDSNNQLVTTISNHYPRQKQASVSFSSLPGKWATVLGASMVIRRDVYEKVNGFDEDFFLYAEETDLCLRIRQQGYKIGYNEEVAVSHVGGASEKKNPPEQVIRRKKTAKYLFYQKHYLKSDVIQIAKKELSQARWHKYFLSLKKKFMSLTAKEEHKLVRHRVSCEVAKEILCKLKPMESP